MTTGDRKTELDKMARSVVLLRNSLEYLRNNPGACTVADLRYMGDRIQQLTQAFGSLSSIVSPDTTQEEGHEERSS